MYENLSDMSYCLPILTNGACTRQTNHIRAENGSVGHGSWVKWVIIFGWVTWVMVTHFQL